MKYLFGLGFRPTRDYFTQVETSPFQLHPCFEQGGIHTVVSVPNLLWHEAPGFFLSPPQLINLLRQGIGIEDLLFKLLYYRIPKGFIVLIM